MRRNSTNKLITAILIGSISVFLGCIYFAFIAPKAELPRSNMEKWNTTPTYAEPYLKSDKYSDARFPDNTLRVTLTSEEAAAIKRLTK